MPIVPGRQEGPGYDVGRQIANENAQRRALYERSVKDGTLRTPDRAAKILKYQAMGVGDEDLIDRNLDEIEKDPEINAPAFDADRFRRFSPRMAKWLAESPNHVAVITDSMESAADLERKFYRRDDPLRPLTMGEAEDWARRIAKRRREEPVITRLQEERATKGEQPISELDWRLLTKPEFWQEIPTGSDQAAIRARVDALREKADPMLKESEEQEYHRALSSILEQEWSIAGKEPIGAFEGEARKFQENPLYTLPFLGSLSEIDRNKAIYDAAVAVKDGTASEDQEDIVLAFGRANAAEERRGRSLMGKVVGGITTLALYALEFAFTGGTYTTTKGSVELLLRDSLKKVLKGRARGIVRETAGAVAGAAAQTVARSPLRLAAGVYGRMAPDFTVTRDDEDQLKLVLESEGDGFAEAMTKQFGSEYVETLSERMGFAIERPVSKAWAPLKAAMFSRWMKRGQGRTVADFFSRLKKATGWNGIIPELFEERVSGAGQAVIEGAGPVEAVKSQIPGVGLPMEDLLAEALAFSAPGAVGFVGSFRMPKTDPTMAQVATAIAQDMKAKNVPPEIVEQLGNALADEGSVLIPVEDFVEHFQSQKDPRGIDMDPLKVAQDMGIEAEYREAVSTGGDVPMSLGKYMRYIAPEHGKAFEKVLRQSPLEENEREAKETEKQVAAEAEKAKPSPEDEESAAIGKSIEQGLRAAGRPAREARHAAAVSESIIRTLSKRYGYKPQELFSKAGIVSISGPKQQVAPEAAAVQGDPVPIPASAGGAKTFEQGKAIPRKAYHVIASGWKGDDLLSLEKQLGSLEDASRKIKERWPDAEEAATDAAQWVYLFDNLDSARKYREEVGGSIVEVDLDAVEVRRDPYEGFLVVHSRVPSHALTDVTDKSFDQPGKEKDPRGRTRVGEGFIDIAVLKDADASTAIHEFGHFWLEILGKLVAEPNAPEALKKDYATILKWIGSENGVITEEQHEKFARGFETYLMEGKAPSAGLRAAFAKFRAWLYDLYKKLTSLNAPLSDGVRAVFDRLMATEEEMAELENQHATGPLFDDIKALGFSEAEAARYSAAIESAKEARRTQLLVKTMESVREKKTAEYAKERKEVRAIVEREVNERRDYRAISILQTGKLPDGTEPDGGSIKLDRQSTLETLQTMSPMFGEDALDQLPRGIFANLKEPQKVDMIAAPDVAADFLGYNSGGELLHAIMTAGDKEAAIDRLTDERMSAERPSIEDEPLAYYDEAVKALHAEGSAEAMREDALILASQQFATSKKLARRIAFSVPSIASLNEMAEREIAKKTPRALQPHLYQRAEKKAGRMAFDAFQKGDYAEAFRLKQLQLVNHALYKAAAAAKDEVEAGRKRARRLEKDSVRAKIGKAGQDYLDQMDKLLERYDFRRIPAKTEKARKALAVWVREQQEMGHEPAVVDTLLDEDRRANYRDITMEEFRGVMEALESIEHLSDRDGQIRTVNGYLSKEVAVEEMVKRAEASLTEKKEPAFPGMKRGLLAWLKDKLSKFDSELVPMETLIELLDGGAVGPWHDYLWNRGADAEAGFHDQLAGVTAKVTALTEKYTKENPSRLTDPILTPLGSMTRQDLISIAFNVGNESNLDKMLRGHDWSEANVMAAVEKLTKKDLEYVQSVWDAIGTLFPQLDDLNRRVQGLPLEKIQPRPLTLRSSDGFVMDMDGGYYPVFYDPRKSDVGKIQESGPLAGLMDEGYARATIPGSARKKRTGYAAPFFLDFTTILQKHLVGVVKDLTYREFLIDAQKILGDPRIRAVLQQRLGEHYEPLFVGSKDSAGWLRSVANEHVSSPKLSALGRLAEAARSRVVVVGLGFKAATALSQFAGLSNSIEYIGANYGTRYFTEAMAEFYRDLPKNLSAEKEGSLRKLIEEKSAAMRHRAETMDREIGDQMRKLKGDKLGSMTSAVSRASMFGIAFADRMISLPTWLAAYRGALAKGATEDQAIHAGDAAVRRSQGSGSAKDLPAMLRERGMTRLFTMFMTPFSAVYGRLRSIREGGRKGWTAKYTAEAVIRAALVTLIPAIIADILAGRGPGDDDKKRKKYGQWIAFKALNGVATTIPILREVAGAWENWAEGKPGDVRWSPVFSAIERVGSTASRARKATVGEDRHGNDIPWTDELAWDAFESSGYVFGLPTGQAAITGEYLTDLLTGEAKADGVGSFLHDLLYRRSAKDRK